ncbi:MAG: hypothetical protein Q9P90_08125 [candidate division KSB1 bacterium]|nr:hypothetical protein [candidate division KSB1 bacterium]
MLFYRRNLPHIIAPGHPFFVTTRLAGSLPIRKLKEIRNELAQSLKATKNLKSLQDKQHQIRRLHQQFFLKYERLLHTNKTGPQWLVNTQVAQVVYDSLMWGDQKRYFLIAFTIMPNHIHVVLLPFFDNQDKHSLSTDDDDNARYVLANIIGNFKKFTARQANKILKRQGAFWQNESYDHLLRNDEELHRSVNYVLMNPVKAGLAKTPEQYRWNYVNLDYL